MTQSTPPVLAGRKAVTLALVAFAMFVVSFDQYIVIVALPEIGRDLGYSANNLQSAISAYAIAMSGFLLLGGRAADFLSAGARCSSRGCCSTGAARYWGRSRETRVAARRPGAARLLGALAAALDEVCSMR